MHEAQFYEKLADNAVQCRLCPHSCRIAAGESGRCRVRKNVGGTLFATTYAEVTSVAMDPIEKKPLYHFYPAQQILSIGTLGCNFRCTFCQNWEISQSSMPTQSLSVKDAVATVREKGSIGVAYTYNEPGIWYEYLSDCVRAMKEEGLRNVLITNGYFNPEPLDRLLPYIDAMNIDIKSIRDEFYREICGGSLKPVLEAAVKAKQNVHVEITHLIIPGHNDTDAEFEELASWIAENLGSDTPVHLSAFFPRYQMEALPTPLATLQRAQDIFEDKLWFVYLGNVRDDIDNDTKCKNCGEILVKRHGYFVEVLALDREGMCNHCQSRSYIVC
jgi:pyruvate formate lyase activating enzyme